MKYTVHCWRYKQGHKFEFQSLEDALHFAAQDTDEHFVEKIVDEEGHEIVDFKGFVAGFPHEKVGETCLVCHKPIEVKAFPVALAGGKRAIGHVCWICLGCAYRGEMDERLEELRESK